MKTTIPAIGMIAVLLMAGKADVLSAAAPWPVVLLGIGLVVLGLAWRWQRKT